MKFLITSSLALLFFWTLSFQALSSNKSKAEAPAKPADYNSNKGKNNPNISVADNKPAHTKDSDLKKTAGNPSKKLKSKRSTANEIDFNDWRRIELPFMNPTNTLYEYKSNHQMLLSLQKEMGKPIEQRKNIENFFKKTLEEKAALISSSRITDLEISSERIENKNEMSLFYIEGSYISPVGNKKMYYKEWSFYTNEISIYILVSLDEPIKTKETQSIQTFIQKWLKPSFSFSEKEKESILAFAENKK